MILTFAVEGCAVCLLQCLRTQPVMTAVYEAKCRVGSIANAYVDRSFIAIAMIFIWQVVYAS